MYPVMMEVTSAIVNGVSPPPNETAPQMKKSSSYSNNLVLPEIPKSSRSQPLGPDCQITKSEVNDPDILKQFEYYWYISHEKGCVECQIKKCEITNTVSTVFPQCIITRKCRRFEAYGCSKCRQHFVTVVQALFHMKSIHRPLNKILIQDLNVFHDIDKAMEIPPVPLPWYALKKKQEIGPIKMRATAGLEAEITNKSQSEAEDSPSEYEGRFGENGSTLSPALLSAASKALKRDKPSKTVRFTLGNPDSDDEESGSASERSDAEPAIKPKPDVGLKGVVESLLSTAAKVSMVPVDPISTMSLLKPASSIMVNAGTGGAATTSLMRVQSWAGSPTLAYNTSVLNETYPNRALNGPGRAYTYAEKIRMMKHMNDRDEAITKEHMKGKLSNSASTPALSAVLRESEIKSKQINEFQTSSSTTLSDEITKEEFNREIKKSKIVSEHPQSLLEMMKNPSSNNTIVATSSSFTPVLSEPHDYYGQGEWAAAARKTMPLSQPVIAAVAVNSSGVAEQQSTHLLPHATTTNQQVTFNLRSPGSTSSLDSSDNEGTPTKRLRKRTISDSSENVSKKQAKLISPKNHGFAKKCASDPALNKKMKPNEDTAISTNGSNNQRIASPGDMLELLEPIVLPHDDIANSHFLTRLRKSDNGGHNDNNSLNMNQLFEKSVAKFLKVSVVEKWSVCCVCGFKIQESLENLNGEADKRLQSHMMEHSVGDILKATAKTK